jgi:hypothetical protein
VSTADIAASRAHITYNTLSCKLLDCVFVQYKILYRTYIHLHDRWPMCSVISRPPLADSEPAPRLRYSVLSRVDSIADAGFTS